MNLVLDSVIDNLLEYPQQSNLFYPEISPVSLYQTNLYIEIPNETSIDSRRYSLNEILLIQ